MFLLCSFVERRETCVPQISEVADPDPMADKDKQR
jgi:hypothetical protein